jgi:hypothetical protein
MSNYGNQVHTHSNNMKLINQGPSNMTTKVADKILEH